MATIIRPRPTRGRFPVRLTLVMLIVAMLMVATEVLYLRTPIIRPTTNPTTQPSSVSQVSPTTAPTLEPTALPIPKGDAVSASVSVDPFKNSQGYPYFGIQAQPGTMFLAPFDGQVIIRDILPPNAFIKVWDPVSGRVMAYVTATKGVDDDVLVTDGEKVTKGQRLFQVKTAARSGWFNSYDSNHTPTDQVLVTYIVIHDDPNHGTAEQWLDPTPYFTG